jgi:transposase
MQETGPDPALIAITSGSSRDYREDLTPWMLALATTHDGDVPVCVQPWDGTSSETASVVAAVQAIQEHWRAPDEAASISVADHGVSSDVTLRSVNQAKVKGISRVSETSTAAQAALAESDEIWHASDDGTPHGVSQMMNVPQGKERRVMVDTSASQPTPRLRETGTRKGHHAGWTFPTSWWPMLVTPAVDGLAQMSVRSKTRGTS